MSLIPRVERSAHAPKPQIGHKYKDIIVAQLNTLRRLESALAERGYPANTVKDDEAYERLDFAIQILEWCKRVFMKKGEADSPFHIITEDISDELKVSSKRVEFLTGGMAKD